MLCREGKESSLELSSSEEQPKEGSKQRSKRSPRSRSPSAHRTGALVLTILHYNNS